MFDAAQVSEELRINEEIHAITDPLLREKVGRLYGQFLNLLLYRFYRTMTGLFVGMDCAIFGAGSSPSPLSAVLLGLLWFSAGWLAVDRVVLAPLHRRLTAKTTRRIALWFSVDPDYAQALLEIRRIAPVYTPMVSRCWRQFVSS